MTQPVTAVERLLLAQVRSELARLKVDCSSSDALLLDVITAALHDEELNEEERRLLESSGTCAVFANRIECAIAAGVRLGLNDGGRQDEYVAPEVVLAVEGDVLRTLEISIEVQDDASPHSILLTNLEGLEILREGVAGSIDQDAIETLCATEPVVSETLPDTEPGTLETLAAEDAAGVGEGVRSLAFGPDAQAFGGGGLARDLLGVMDRLAQMADKAGVSLLRSPREMVGTLFDGKYELRKLLGEGGFGAVFRSFDILLKTEVAIKMMLPRAARAPEALENFKDEARRVVRLNHPNIIRWRSFNEPAGAPVYFVMELLEGEELAVLLRREGRLPYKRARHLMMGVLDALHHAHKREEEEPILHLDLKPQNIFITKDEKGREIAIVIDFGIGGYTPEYASPEQHSRVRDLDAPAPDERSDLYSFGITAFMMLTGVLPFERPSDRKEYGHIHRNVPPHRTGAMPIRIPRRLAAFVDQCLVKDRDERWRDTETAHAALERIVRPPRWIAGAQIAAAVLAVLVPVVLWALSGGVQLPDVMLNNQDGALSENSILEFGPNQTERSLSFVSLEVEDPYKWMILPVSGDEELEGWNVALTRERELLIQPELSWTKDQNELVYLRVGQGKRWQRSKAFYLHYHARESWTLGDEEISHWNLKSPTLGETFHPQEQTLQVSVDLKEGTLDAENLRLEADHAEWRQKAIPNIDGSQAIFTLDLDALLSEGQADAEQVEINYRVWDEGGNEQSGVVKLPVDRRPLGFEVVKEKLPDLLPDDSYFTCCAEELVIAYKLAREASVKAQLFRKNDKRRESPLQDILADHQGAGEWELKVPMRRETGNIEKDGPYVLVLEAVAVNQRGWTIPPQEIPLDLTYFTSLPKFGVFVGDLPLKADALDSKTVTKLYLEKAPTRLEVFRMLETKGALKVRLEIEAGEDQDQWQECELSIGEETAAFIVPMLQDGLNRLTLTGFYTGRGTEEAAENATFVAKIDLILDAKEELLTLHWSPAPPNGYMATSDQLREVGVEWTWKKQGSVSTPIENLSLRMTRVGLPDQVADNLDPNAARVTLEKAFPDLRVEDDSEGEYLLVANATDEAGRLVSSERVQLIIATRGPTLEPSKVNWPWVDEDKRWVPDPDSPGKWTVTVEPSDPNGVKAVTGTLTAEEVQDREVNFKKVDGERWAGTVELDDLWSKKVVTLQVTMEDGCGRVSHSPPHELTLVDIKPRLAPTIEVFMAGQSPSIMHALEGNRGEDYVCLGRNAARESDTYRNFGLETPQRYDGPRVPFSTPSEVRLEAGDILSFYLDENEVTVSEFLEAVDGGFLGEPARWAYLREEEGDLPVHNVSWEDARAFAQCRGKRLPTLAEWEFAVRGMDYRPHSMARKGAGAPDSKSINLDSKASWAVASGKDVTPEGIRNLCSNVAEWTATSQLPTTQDDWREALLRKTNEDNTRHYYVGGNWNGVPADFWVKGILRPDEQRRWIGFRCALDAGKVKFRLGERSEEGSLTVKEILRNTQPVLRQEGSNN